LDELYFLTLQEVLGIHDMELGRTGGEPGVRDLGLLESAIAQPVAGFGGTYLHHDIFEMAAAYIFHLAKNHPFVDGNKRTAALSALTFLDVNGITIEVDDDDLASTVERTVVDEIGKAEIADFLRTAAQR
jgi:death on curing protein